MKKNNLEENLIQLQGNMLQFARTLTSDRDESLDLLQETTLKVLTNKEKFTDDKNFKGWVLTIMKNIFINNYRRESRNQTVNDQTDNSFLLQTPVKSSGFDTPEGAYTMNEINKCINSFSEEYRLPFSMYVDGFKYHEIAEKIQIPVGTVKSRIFHARHRLQDHLKDYKQ